MHSKLLLPKSGAQRERRSDLVPDFGRESWSFGDFLRRWELVGYVKPDKLFLEKHMKYQGAF